MKLTNNVHSSSLEFKRIESNVDSGNIDTIYFRFNEKKWMEDGVHVGWIYDEYQYSLFEFVNTINSSTEDLESDVAQVWFDNVMKDGKITANEQEIADLWFANLGGV